jgi:hypothetical protein
LKFVFLVSSPIVWLLNRLFAAKEMRSLIEIRSYQRLVFAVNFLLHSQDFTWYQSTSPH